MAEQAPEPDYKAVLFEVLENLAHMTDDGADRTTMEWLLVMRNGAERHDEHALLRATQEAIEHLSLSQARRLLDRTSGRDGG